MLHADVQRHSVLMQRALLHNAAPTHEHGMCMRCGTVYGKLKACICDAACMLHDDLLARLHLLSPRCYPVYNGTNLCAHTRRSVDTRAGSLLSFDKLRAASSPHAGQSRDGLPG